MVCPLPIPSKNVKVVRTVTAKKITVRKRLTFFPDTRSAKKRFESDIYMHACFIFLYTLGWSEIIWRKLNVFCLIENGKNVVC